MIEIRNVDDGISLQCSECRENYQTKYYTRNLAKVDELREWLDLHEGKVEGGTEGLCFHITANYDRMRVEADREDMARRLRDEACLRQRELTL